MTAWFILQMDQEERLAVALSGVVFFLLLFGVCKILSIIFDDKDTKP